MRGHRPRSQGTVSARAGTECPSPTPVSPGWRGPRKQMIPLHHRHPQRCVPGSLAKSRVLRQHLARLLGNPAAIELQHPLPFAPGLRPLAPLDERVAQVLVRQGIQRVEADRLARLTDARLGLGRV